LSKSIEKAYVERLITDAKGHRVEVNEVVTTLPHFCWKLQMKLQVKTLLAVGATLSILVVLLYNVAWVSMVDGALRLEQEQVEKSALQAKAALATELTALGAVARDYAIWDDNQMYIDEKHDDYTKRLGAETMQALQLNYVLLLDNQGQLVFDKHFMGGQELPLPEDLLTHLSPEKPLLGFSEKPLDSTFNVGATGLLLLEGKPLLVVTRPILSRHSGQPRHGTLLMARYLDEVLLRRLSTNTQLTLRISRYDPEILPANVQNTTNATEEAFALHQDDNTTFGFMLLRDVYGAPILFLQVQIERSYLAAQLASIHYLLGVLLVLSLVFGALIMMTLRLFILSRLSRLSEQAQRIGSHGDLGLRVQAEGQDELSSLANSINVMLEALKNGEQKKQETLRESEERYRQLIELSPDAVIIHSQGKVTFANTTASRLLGASSSALLLGRELTGFITNANERETLLGQWQEGRGQRLDGRVVDLEMTTVAFPSAQRPSLQLIARDVTARKQTEQKLFLADRMSSVGTLAAGVAHEINNPLSCVLLNFQYLANTLKQQGHHSAEVEEMILDGLEATGRIRMIVKDLSTFSRADEELRGPVDLSLVIESALRLVRHELSHRARLSWIPVGEMLVTGNEARLVQVFVNLLINAAQSFPERSVEQNELSIVLYHDGKWVIAEVRDNGTGISSGSMRRIFDPFFTTKPVGAGTGLGLSICHNIIATLGGKIHVESASAQGTCFSVFLPRTDDAPPLCQVEEPQPALTPCSRVLVIDDDPLVGRVLERILSKEHEVIIMNNARDALDSIAAGTRYHAILCDLMMPGLSGVEFYEELERQSPEMALRVGIISGGAFTPRTHEFLQRFVERSIEKPFEPNDIRRLIEKLIS
jgi:PAS domain S-box-containing protein